MYNEEAVRLLVLDPDSVDQVWPLLDESYGIFDDNGVEPDGPSWCCEADALDPDELETIVKRNLGYEADGFRISGYSGDETDHREMHKRFPLRWCGYSSRNVAYGIKALGCTTKEAC